MFKGLCQKKTNRESMLSVNVQWDGMGWNGMNEQRPNNDNGKLVQQYRLEKTDRQKKSSAITSLLIKFAESSTED